MVVHKPLAVTVVDAGVIVLYGKLNKTKILHMTGYFEKDKTCHRNLADKPTTM